MKMENGDQGHFKMGMRLDFYGAIIPLTASGHIVQTQQNLQYLNLRCWFMKDDKAAINHMFYRTTVTAHKWQPWRRSLYQFAHLMFK
jgi:hypothetical protein